MSMVLLEVCVESVFSAKTAVCCGAGRLELCTALSQGGLTPTVGLLRCVKDHAEGIPVMCLIRCRAGNFNYSTEDIQVMLEDIKSLKENGADGFVIGALNESGEIDVERCKRLRAACGSLPVTFHRAFDFSIEPIPVALQKVKQIGCSRILTSGRKGNVTAGEDTLVELVREATPSKIIIMPGGGITADNIDHIANKTQAEELHMSASSKDSQPMPGMGLPMTVDLCALQKALGKLRYAENAKHD